MNNFVIVTDSTCDLSEDFLLQNNIEVMQLSFLLDDVLYDQKNNTLSPQEFYAKMRAGATPVTQQVNPDNAFHCFEFYAKQAIPILCINLSSKLSGTFQSALIAKEDILEQYPDAKITVIDTLSASMGEGVLVYHAAMLKKQGKTFDEVTHWLMEHIQKTCHLILVDDLNHLHRGGRLSKGAAMVGGLLNIKPILKIDDTGAVIPFEKIRGRQQALTRIVELFKKQALLTNISCVSIAHADSIADATTLYDMITPLVPDATVMINFVGPTVGTHVGPGALGVFFVGTNR